MRAPQAKAGFAMPLVLAGVAVLTLVFAVALNSLITLKRETQNALERAEFERVALTGEARMAFLMTTEFFGASSVNIGGSSPDEDVQIEPLASIYIDSRPYAWREVVGDPAWPAYIAEFQDEAGLVNLFQTDELILSRLFQQIAGLDPVDADNLAAEIMLYEPSTPFRRPAELFRIESVGLLIGDAQWRRLSERLAGYTDSEMFNINTAPAEVLAVMFDLSIEQAEDIVYNREGVVLNNPDDIGVVVTGDEDNYAFSDGRIRYTLTDPVSGLSYRSSLVLTPDSAERPVWAENPQVLRLPFPPETSPDALEEFPQVPDFPVTG